MLEMAGIGTLFSKSSTMGERTEPNVNRTASTGGAGDEDRTTVRHFRSDTVSVPRALLERGAVDSA